MTLILGIDPGANGAFVTYDTDARRVVTVKDMPVWYQIVNKTKRKRIDPLALAEMFETYQMMGVQMAVLEAVGGRPKEANNFVFGYGVGMIYMSLVYSKIPIETIVPATWKAFMRVPGKTKADDSAIMHRAGELFPQDKNLFYGPRGGMRVDVAEAAMLAMFGGDHILKSSVVTKDPQWELAYRDHVVKADMGA